MGALMNEIEVTIPAGDVTLAATLVTPGDEGPYPAALLIAGSGPLDRDGNHKQLPLAVSRDLAELLAAHGWASLRFDKRGVGASTGDYLSAGLEDEFTDARHAASWLSERADIGTVVAIGHSVGALSAAEMSAWSDTVAGAILLAYTAHDGMTTLTWQASEIGKTVPGWIKGVLKVFGSSIEKQQAKAITRLQSTTDDVVRIQGQKINAKWMREFIAYDPQPVLRATRTPLLVLTGSKDVQVDPNDLEIVRQVAGDRARVVLADGVDHILRHEDQPVSNPKRYKKQITKPLDPVVTTAILDWLTDLYDGAAGTLESETESP
jgi:alpha/beta superfamily hydrolase